MNVAIYQIFIVVFLSVSSAEPEAYEIYHLESICNSKNDEGEIHIPAWGAAILKLGHNPKYEYTPAGTWAAFKIAHCTVNIEAEEGFSLALVIEDMNIRGRGLDRTRNEWDCSDYVMFSTVGKWSDIANAFLPNDPFKSKKSRQVCGQSHNAGDNIKDIQLKDIISSRSQGNVFFTKYPNIEVLFHQNQNPYNRVNNSFTFIITTYKRTEQSCEGRLYCSSSKLYCVNKAFKCDNHINCALPNSGDGGDENPNECIVEAKATLSTSTTIIIILVCISGAALLLFYVCVLKSKRQISSEYPMDNNNTTQAAMRQQSLPMYEAVVAFDAEHSDVVIKEPTPADPNDVPPSYDQLFPDGHPKEKEGSDESPEAGATADDLPPTTGTVPAEEIPKIPVTGSG